MHQPKPICIVTAKGKASYVLMCRNNCLMPVIMSHTLEKDLHMSPHVDAKL